MTTKSIPPILCLLIAAAFVFTGRFAPSALAADVEADGCPRIQRKLRDIKSLMQRKLFLQSAILKCPDDAMLQYYWAFNLERRKQFKKAFQYYQLSAKLKKNFPQAYFGMGEIYLAQGDITGAVNAYKHGLQIKPVNKWGKARLDEILVLADNHPALRNNAGSRAADSLPPSVNDSATNDYTKKIAKRYGINLADLIQARKQMSDLRKIAGRYGIALDELIEANRQAASHSGPKISNENAGTEKTERTKAKEKYLAAISKRYGIQLNELTRLSQQMASIKDIADRYGIRVDELMQPGGKMVSFERQTVSGTKHKVLKNEYLTKIAKRYGVSLNDIIRANKNITDPHWIFPGQIITIPEKKRRN